MTPAISVAGLTRRYRGQVALDDVTLDLEPGSITGLLGRNGAGKTTLLRIVAGHEFASASTVMVLGACPVENETVLSRMVFVREDQSHPGPAGPAGRSPPGSTRTGATNWPARCSRNSTCRSTGRSGSSPAGCGRRWAS